MVGKEFSCALAKIPFKKESTGEDCRTVRHIDYSKLKKNVLTWKTWYTLCKACKPDDLMRICQGLWFVSLNTSNYYTASLL